MKYISIKRGISLPLLHEHTKNNKPDAVPDFEFYHIDLKTPIDEALDIQVAEGDVVKEGQLLARGKGKSSAFFAPVSGKVVTINKSLSAHGVGCKTIVIRNDYLHNKQLLENVQKNRGGYIKRMLEAGVVCTEPMMQGALYTQYLQNTIQDFTHGVIINATDTEPFKTNEQACLQYYMEQVVQGSMYLADAANTKNIIFLVNKAQSSLVPDLEKVFASYKNYRCQVYLLPNIYPLYGTYILQCLKKAKVLALHGKYTLQTACDAYAMYRACVENEVDIERIVTVESDEDIRWGNYFIKRGTLIQDILDFVKVQNMKAETVVADSIMRGYAQEKLDIGVYQGMRGLFFLHNNILSEKETTCIDCGKCADVCPVRLMPMWLDRYANEKDMSRAKKYGVELCIGCGNCSYICPARRHVTQRIVEFKKGGM